VAIGRWLSVAAGYPPIDSSRGRDPLADAGAKGASSKEGISCSVEIATRTVKFNAGAAALILLMASVILSGTRCRI
jgi:hypothetical protein